MTSFPAADLVAAYKTAPLVINSDQAEALAALLWDGRLRGTRYPDTAPPRTAAIIALSERETLDQPLPLRDRRTGEVLPDPGDDRHAAMCPPMPASHTIGVLAEDGRCWSIVRAGICWPLPLPPESELEDRADENP